MTEYVGLDVSMKETAIAVLNGEGELIKEGKVPSWPEDIERFVRRWAPSAARLGLESGSLSSWLYEELQTRGLPVVCIDARHAKAALSLQVNKNDRNDARGLAQIMRMGWYREVRIKSQKHRWLAGLLATRGLLLATRRNLENQVRGLLKMAGIRLGRVGSGRFRAAVEAAVETHVALAAVLRPLLQVRAELVRQLAGIERVVRKAAWQDEIVRLLMTVPGVGAIVATTYKVVIDDPRRFPHSRQVGVYLGLTPRLVESGETSYTGHISKRGDKWLRVCLYEAAHVLLTRSKDCPLKRWAQRLAKKVGDKKAKVALARKLAIILHRMWADGTAFQWGKEAAMA
jgi:transposase